MPALPLLICVDEQANHQMILLCYMLLQHGPYIACLLLTDHHLCAFPQRVRCHTACGILTHQQHELAGVAAGGVGQDEQVKAITVVRNALSSLQNAGPPPFRHRVVCCLSGATSLYCVEHTLGVY